MSTGLGWCGMSSSTAAGGWVVYGEEDMLPEATEGLTEEDSDGINCNTLNKINDTISTVESSDEDSDNVSNKDRVCSYTRCSNCDSSVLNNCTNFNCHNFLHQERQEYYERDNGMFASSKVLCQECIELEPVNREIFEYMSTCAKIFKESNKNFTF